MYKHMYQDLVANNKNQFHSQFYFYHIKSKSLGTNHQSMLDSNFRKDPN
jgi:hypothetical protein